MRSFLLVWNYYHQNLLFTAQANVKPLFSKEAGYNQRFLVYSVSFINFLVIFSISFAVYNNVVFWAVCISILIFILYFSKFFVTLPRALKTTGIMSIFLKFQSLWISLTFQSSSFPCQLFSCSHVLPHLWLLLSHSSLWLKFSVTVWELRWYHFSDFWRLNFSYSFQWTILATLSCLLLYSLWASFENWLTIFSPVSPHILKMVNQHIYQYCIWRSSYCLLLCRAFQGLSGLF